MDLLVNVHNQHWFIVQEPCLKAISEIASVPGNFPFSWKITYETELPYIQSFHIEFPRMYNVYLELCK